MHQLNSLTVERISTFEDFVSLEAEWSMIGDRSCSIFLYHFWLMEWWKIYGDTCELWVLTVRDGGSLIGLLPLIRKQTNFGSYVITIMGSGEITPNDLNLLSDSVRKSEAIKAIAEYLEKTLSIWDMLEFDKITADGPMKDDLGDHFSKRGFIMNCKASAKCSYISLPTSFDEYLKSRSHNMRRRLHKAQRNLIRDFPQASFKMVKTEDELNRVMSALIRLHQNRWTQKGYPGAFSNDKFVCFHKAVSLQALRKGLLRSYYIESGSEIIAVRYGYQTPNSFQGYLGSFDERWSDYSPGVLLTGHVIKQSIAQGLSYYDFLEGDESYKRDWATHRRDNFRLRVFNPGLRGRLIHIYLSIAEFTTDWIVRFVPVQIRRPIWQTIQRWTTRQNLPGSLS